MTQENISWKDIETRSLISYLNENNSKLDILQSKTGNLFAKDTVSGKLITISKRAQEDITANGAIGAIEDYQIANMPAIDKTTKAVIPGQFFLLLTKVNRSNVKFTIG